MFQAHLVTMIVCLTTHDSCPCPQGHLATAMMCAGKTGHFVWVTCRVISR